MADDITPTTLLRVQVVTTGTIGLENQDGPIDRHFLQVTVSALFPESHQEAARTLNLIFDRTQLAQLREHLLGLDLPPPSEAPPLPSIQ